MKPQTQTRCGTDSKAAVLCVCLRFVSPEDAEKGVAGYVAPSALFLIEEQGGYDEDRVARGYATQNRLVGIKREGNGRIESAGPLGVACKTIAAVVPACKVTVHALQFSPLALSSSSYN